MHYKKCKTLGCNGVFQQDTIQDFCPNCTELQLFNESQAPTPDSVPMSQQYPQYYKSVEHLDEIDVYVVHHLFNIQDPSGAIQHASKKLLLSGVRTGGKTQLKDIKEARDTLTRWLQINAPT
jgi:hypothetical protein